MINQILIIYRFKSIFDILKELENEINFIVLEAINEKVLKNKIEENKNILIITRNSIKNFNNQLLIQNLPIKLNKFIEMINVEFLKKNFIYQSNIKINNYNLNLNSREMSLNDIKLKLTEKEIKSIIYLSNMKNPVSIEELEKNVWQYNTDIETHTVETHIYRLRKKILETFEDENFIRSEKNGYQIK